MKKIIIISIPLFIVSVTSCNKHRTCECVDTGTLDGVGYSYSSTEFSSSKLNKKDAESWCNAEEYVYNDIVYDEVTLEEQAIIGKVECNLIK